ncbi:hypothetical protein CWO04_01270 [Vibrio splendidus]|uniref:Uncharacterized protein n=1 Tax=Vibrio splendidus TaxID=29497 RepID=A0A2J6UQU8_VIBSP|nr:hypothetical protein [Vibrio splendidus]PMF18672.1 hypothetical protein BCV19_15555 [Vibrio splendidus]PMH10406.1 hypothetical protein BCU77_08055 [Vibrio splendidus]PTP65617.1 hypothetical protein CWO01_01480 [Vibrio splendidus]PTP90853.1 hypothetical protein CWO04_01270 [Vibrio splendidus]
MNTALAADGNYTGTIDMNLIAPNKTNVERVESEPVLQSRNEASSGGLKFQIDTKDQAIELTGRRD